MMNRPALSYRRILSAELLISGLLTGAKPASATLTVLHSFSNNYFTPAYPVGALQSYGGKLYGAAEWGFNGEGSLFSMTTNGAVTVLHNFTSGANDGNQPWAGPIIVSGKLYGTTTYGGSNGIGVMYEYNLTTSTFSLLHTFTGTNSGTPSLSDGAYPEGALLYNPADGYLYGVTTNGDEPGSTNNQGTVYKIKTDGTGYAVIYDFLDTAGGGYAYDPGEGLALDSTGYLWGTTDYAAGYNGGLFKLKTDGTGYQFMFGFSSAGSNPYNPESDVITASDGNLYFECVNGGAYGFGTIEKVVPSTGAVTTLWNFDGYTGAYPYDQEHGTYLQRRLFQGATDHNLYGVTSDGGTHGLGTLYKLTLAGVATPVANFSYADAANYSNPPIQVGTSFYLTSYYGGVTAANGGTNGDGAAMSVTSTGTLKVIQSFYTQDVYSTQSGLVQDGSLLYAAGINGGNFSCGGVYTINPTTGAYNVIHNFNNNYPTQPGTGWEGAYAHAPLLLNPNDGSLYGDTDGGGRYGSGTLFKMSKTGTYTKIRDIDAGTDGYYLADALTVGYGSDKYLYGAFYYSGLVEGGPSGGTIFKTDTAGKNFSVLHAFSSANGGPYDPYSTIVEDSTNTLWGATYVGGAHGYGTIFKISNKGAGFTDVYDFDSTHGAYPYLDRLALVGSVLYGTTQSGGTNGDGVIWSYNTSTNTFSVVYNFNNNSPSYNGYSPYGGVVYSSTNNALYGTCYGGGASGDGTVWSYNLGTSAFTVLHSFTGYNSGNPPASDGANPYEGVILGSDGLLHGTTYNGGQYNQGTLFTQTLTP